MSDPDTVVHPAVDVLAEVEREPSAVPTPEGSILGVLIFLLCLGGAAAGLVWWKRQRVSLAGLSASAQNIHVETTRAIGPKQYLVVARVGRERFLVGTGPQGPQLVSRLEDVPETFSVPGGDASGREESI